MNSLSKPLDTGSFAEVARRIAPGSKLRKRWSMSGGISAQVTVLEIERANGALQRLVVRQHGERDFAANRMVAGIEYKLLQITHSAGLPTPAPYYLDDSGEVFARPYVVIEYIDGEPEFEPSNLDHFIAQFALQLSRIHEVDSSRYDLSFLPDLQIAGAERLAALQAISDEALQQRRIQMLLNSRWPFPRTNSPVLLHGDYWPGNLLWRNGKIVGVIDWEDAKVGDPLADLANARLELLWAFGPEAMHTFTRQYQSIAQISLTALPYWDLYAALRHARNSTEWSAYQAGEERTREGYYLFVEQALEQLEAVAAG